jgi:monoamine oxidase
VGASAVDRQQKATFEAEIAALAARRTPQGRRSFALPISAGDLASDELAALDAISMATWLRREGFTSDLLKWWVDYACRDDYGALSTDISALAGLHYFASRFDSRSNAYQPVVTWPAGNGRLVQHLVDSIGGERFLLERAAVSIRNTEQGVVTTLRGFDGAMSAIEARYVVAAMPQFVAARIVPELSKERRQSMVNLQHGAWMVANIQVREPPTGLGFPLAWDNVLFGSPSLGYVVANHQSGAVRGQTMLTYYYPLVDSDCAQARRRLLSLDWEHWAEVVLSDLERAHPTIRDSVERIDVARWGHGMVRPVPGTLASAPRRTQPVGRIHWAHSDLSGVALFEESLDQGVRAGEEILANLGKGAERWR